MTSETLMLPLRLHICQTCTLACHLSLGNSMIRASHRSSEGCGFDPHLGLRNLFPEVRGWRTFIDNLRYLQATISATYIELSALSNNCSLFDYYWHCGEECFCYFVQLKFCICLDYICINIAIFVVIVEAPDWKKYQAKSNHYDNSGDIDYQMLKPQQDYGSYSQLGKSYYESAMYYSGTWVFVAICSILLGVETFLTHIKVYCGIESVSKIWIWDKYRVIYKITKWSMCHWRVRQNVLLHISVLFC